MGRSLVGTMGSGSREVVSSSDADVESYPPPQIVRMALRGVLTQADPSLGLSAVEKCQSSSTHSQTLPAMWKAPTGETPARNSRVGPGPLQPSWQRYSAQLT